ALQGAARGLDRAAGSRPGGQTVTTRDSGSAREEHLGRALYDIAHALGSAGESDQRVLRVLEILKKIVPYERCALLHAQPGRAPRVLVAPAASPVDSAVTQRLMGLFGLLAEEHAPV